MATVEFTQQGLANVGRPGEQGALVRYDVNLDREGETLTTFVGVLHSLDGTDLARFYGGNAVLTLMDGPAVEITVIHIDDDDAIFQLTPPFAWPGAEP